MTEDIDLSSVHTLVVDDDEVTIMAVERAFQKADINSPLHVARDGIEALEMLRGESGREAVPRPYLIFLDLNMPRMNGLEFLDEVRSDPNLEDSVIFVLTTSSQETDRQQAYRHAIAGYIEKAKAGASYQELVSLLRPYWKLVELPG